VCFRLKQISILSNNFINDALLLHGWSLVLKINVQPNIILNHTENISGHSHQPKNKTKDSELNSYLPKSVIKYMQLHKKNQLLYKLTIFNYDSHKIHHNHTSVIIVFCTLTIGHSNNFCIILILQNKN